MDVVLYVIVLVSPTFFFFFFEVIMAGTHKGCDIEHLPNILWDLMSLY